MFALHFLESGYLALSLIVTARAGLADSGRAMRMRPFSKPGSLFLLSIAGATLAACCIFLPFPRSSGIAGDALVCASFAFLSVFYAIMGVNSFTNGVKAPSAVSFALGNAWEIFFVLAVIFAVHVAAPQLLLF